MESCKFCQNEAVDKWVCYTTIIEGISANNKKEIPFRDPQRHVYPVCSEHSGNSIGVRMLVSKMAIKEHPTDEKPNFLEEIKFYDETSFQKIQPITMKYHVTVTNEEIEEVLSASVDELISTQKNLAKGRTDARRNVALLGLLGFIAGIVLFILGVAIDVGLLIGGGCLLSGIFPIVVIWQFVRLGKTPGGKSPQAIAETFYGAVSDISPEFSKAESVLAFQSLAPTVANRSEANSVESLQLIWSNTWKELTEKMVTKAQGNSFSRGMPQITIISESEDTARIECEIQKFIDKGFKHVGWAIVQFDNLAVRIGDKWYLMAGEPGELQVVD
jgi:hypothetical protein